MLLFEQPHRFLGASAWSDDLRYPNESIMVLFQTGFADREQVIQRNIDHLFESKLVGEALSSDRVAAGGTHRNIRLQMIGHHLKCSGSLRIGAVEIRQ